ncbi:MAG TPA: thrombospondin type 3 repeat-containing protein [Dehalococcoidia bacterium]|nr:thrombospondin type 3 repeat-containing protein [Dehalococcoidia bacterium]
MALRGKGLLMAVLVAAILGILAIDPASGSPPPFSPGGVMCFETLETAVRCDGDTAPGAATDVRLTFCVGWNDDCTVRDIVATDSMAAGMVMFTPPDWTVPKGDTLPVGAIAGRVEEELHVGALNSACNNRISASGTLLNASINVNDTIEPRPDGDTAVMQPLAMDANGNGIPDGADRYPAFLAEYFQIDGNILQPRARLFAASHIQGNWVTENILFFEPGTTLELAQTRITFDPALGYPAVVMLQDPLAPATAEFCAPTLFDLVVMGNTLDNPCTPAAVTGANCPVTADVAPEFLVAGYPAFPCDPQSTFDEDGDGVINDGCPRINDIAESGTECENDISEDSEDSTVNDGCPQVGEVSEGSRIPGECSSADEGGCIQRSNPPAAGIQTFTVAALSGRDADGDGIDNGLDVCFDKPNAEWNPWGPDPVNDADGDGLPNVCDPLPSEASPGPPNGCLFGYTGLDQDQDCYSNRLDNCPTTNQLENPAQPPGPTNRPLQTDTDGDRIGDACDPDLLFVNGEYIGHCLKFGLDVGGGGGSVVGTKATVAFWPECAATPICAGCQPGRFETYITCSLGNPVFLPTPTPSEITTITSDVTVYATVVHTVGLLMPPLVEPITFSDEPGLGAVDPTTAPLDDRGAAKTTYRLPSDLLGTGMATVTATTANGKSCSVSFRIAREPAALPRTGGGSPTDGTAAVAVLGLATLAIGGTAVIGLAKRRRA